MAWTFPGGAGVLTTGNNAASLTPVLPGHLVGDLLIVQFQNFGGASARVPQVPAGWGGVRTSSGNVHHLLIWFVSTDGATPNPTIVLSGTGVANDTQLARAFRFSPTFGTVPTLRQAGTGTVNASADDIGPIGGVTITAGDLLILSAGKANDFTGNGTLAGWTQAAVSSSTTGNDAGMALLYMLSGPGGATGTAIVADAGATASLGVGIGQMLGFYEVIPPVTGTGSATFSGYTASGSGSETISGSGTATFSGYTATGAGAETIAGSGSASYGGYSASGTGSSLSSTDVLLRVGTAANLFSTAFAETVTGTGAATFSGYTSSGTGTHTLPTVTGSGTATFSAYTATGTGTETITGSGAATFSAYTAAGVGTSVLPTVTGSGSATYGSWSASGTGTVSSLAQDVLLRVGSTTTLQATVYTLAPVDVLLQVGTGASILSTVFTATVVITGTGAATFTGYSASGTGAERIQGAGAATFSGYTASGAGSLTLPTVTGAGTATFSGYSATGVGSSVEAVPVTGVGAATFAGYLASGVGLVALAPPPPEGTNFSRYRRRGASNKNPLRLWL